MMGNTANIVWLFKKKNEKKKTTSKYSSSREIRTQYRLHRGLVSSLEKTDGRSRTGFLHGFTVRGARMGQGIEKQSRSVMSRCIGSLMLILPICSNLLEGEQQHRDSE